MPFRSGALVYYSPLALLGISPINFQNKQVQGLIFSVQLQKALETNWGWSPFFSRTTSVFVILLPLRFTGPGLYVLITCIFAPPTHLKMAFYLCIYFCMICSASLWFILRNICFTYSYIFWYVCGKR